MRDLLRLIAVAAMSFAVVGIAMVYSREGDLGTGIRSVADTVGSAFASVGELVTGTPETVQPAAPGYRITVDRPLANQWIGLAGFPDQTEIAFPLPRGAQFTGGALDLSFDTQLSEQGDGLLTLSVNGTPRGQVVLDAGHRNHSVRIALSPADLIGDRVVLHMAGRGTTNSGQICPTDAANSGSAVTLSAASRLELDTETPLTDAVGALVTSPTPFVVAAGAAEGDAALSIWAAQALDRAGIAARLGSAGAGETALGVSGHAVNVAGENSENSLVGKAAVDELIAAVGALSGPQAWPVGVADLGAETVVKSFRGSRRWTVPFAIADLPGGMAPQAFALRLKSTPLTAGNDWVVRVTLNSNLIETRRVAGGTDLIGFDVALPPERLLPTNVLAVELVDTTPNEGICTRIADAQAQLLPESALLDGVELGTGWGQLIAALAQRQQVSIATSGTLGVAQANQAAELLALVLPQSVDVDFSGRSGIELRIVDKAGFAAALAAIPSGSEIRAVVPVAGTRGPIDALSVPSAGFASAFERLGPDDVVILVSGL